MSTRATYQFIGNITGTHTAYIHHDGYPEYAFNYIKGNNNIDSFITNNEKAEITESHDEHGDTEYRYTIQNDIVVCQKRNFDTDSFDIIFIGTIEQFVSKYEAEYKKLCKQHEELYVNFDNRKGA